MAVRIPELRAQSSFESSSALDDVLPRFVPLECCPDYLLHASINQPSAVSCSSLAVGMLVIGAIAVLTTDDGLADFMEGIESGRL